MIQIQKYDHYYCPNCGNPMDYDKAVWLVSGRFYCSEGCARQARGLYR